MKKSLSSKKTDVTRGTLNSEQQPPEVHSLLLTQPVDRYILLARLLPALPDTGMILSPDRYIRLQLLLDALPSDVPASALSPYLVPIFATDPFQQERFADLMADALRPLPGEFGAGKMEQKSTGGTPETAPKSASKPLEQDMLSNPNIQMDTLAYTVDLEQCDEPPYVWSIAPKEPVHITEGSEYVRTLMRLRSREASDLRMLDWPATIRASIAGAGMPALHYRARTRPVEYLLLVERYGTDDHRALLFDRLYHNLRQQEVLIDRYFHDGDPRRCYNEVHPEGIPLRELRYRHQHARLLFMGNGYRLLNPDTGQPADWVHDTLLGWNTRLLLTPLARERWGLREFNLKSMFLLLPAAWESLRYIAEYPQPDQNLRFAELPDYVRTAAEWPQKTLEAPYLPDLRAQLTHPLLRWVAACAVWPTLHFDLTLQLGRLLSDDTHELLHYSHLARLAALPWFANGHIPKVARRELLEYLEVEHPDTLHRTAQHLLTLLKNYEPENPRSHAAAEHTLYFAMLQAMATPKPDKNTLSHLRTVLKRLGHHKELTDFVFPPSLVEELRLPNIGIDAPDSPVLDPSPPKMDLIEGGHFGESRASNDSEFVIGKKYILGIGINAYLNKEWPKVGNAVKDMEDVIRLLTNRYQFDGISKLTDGDATRDNIENELYRFTDETVLGPNDSLLIYYSGHGYLDNNQRGYWVPVGAKKGMIASYFPNSRILEIISDMKARHVLLISDSCYSGSLFTQNRSESKDDLLAHEYEKRKSRWAFCSGRSDEEVSDGTNGNSPFAKALLSVLNANSNGRINLGRIAGRVAHGAFNNSKQLPAFGPLQNTGDLGGQFVFTLKGFVPDKEDVLTGGELKTAALIGNPASISSREELAYAIKKLLADDQTDEAIKLIIAYEDAGLSKVRDTAILLSGRWKALEREDQEGTIDSRELQAGKNKLRGNVLTLVDSIYKPTVVSELDALKSELRTHIARAQTGDAIKKLLNWAIPEMTEDLRNVVFGISAEWETYRKDELRGILDSRDAEKTRNIINFKLLNIISSL